MSFLWPWLLLAYLLIPLLIGAYIWVLRRRRKYAVRYSSLSLIREALPRRSRWRQHVPFALFLLAVGSLITAAGRPQDEVRVPLNRTTIILALDVSRSMCATDVDPNRLAVAQEAALEFIDTYADDIRIGVVAFAGFAEIVVPPTNDRDVLHRTVENLATSFGTAIGSATLKSIDAIAEYNEEVAPSGIDLSPGTDESPRDPATGYQPDIIVLLTDGANSRGPLPVDAARQAADRGVRIYTIGFGTTSPQQLVCTPEQLGGDVFSDGFGGWGGGGFRGGGPRRYLLLDEPTLQEMAEVTGGEYFRAENAEQLYDVFAELPNEVVFQTEHVEISFLFTLIGAVLLVIAIGLGVLWFR
ncbi:MAG TPA: VWA domain-containing protein [Aggregatilineales bacterium]|nr:VWA domain-containing protein [Aggregatilineales bacterium]HPV07886.1 VWA domain-containing protein [Aggregatilineales bacterium]HQA68011.1 VWA domain-containing protein [Aggregatilineales bacterium]HQE18388.1 VWA domain-containing protein [Aggregatilineales bacterium]